MKSLFDETRIGSMYLKNRFIRSATGDHFVKEGHPTEEMLKLYENLANGGVGTIITGITKVVDFGTQGHDMLSVYDDSHIESLKKLTDTVHSHGTNIILQLGHMGSIIGTEGDKIWGPSSIENLASKIKPKEMTKEDIKTLQEAFAYAALRAKKAGFDGIQLHAAHGFLLSQFLTSYYNRRTDEYGGTIENRARMLLETCQLVREKVGNEYPILIKINGTDDIEQGMTFEECRCVCKKLREVGVDAIEISGDPMRFSPKQESYFKDYASVIASENNIPIILVGGNKDYATMETMLNETSIEYFSLSRPLIAEADLVKRWQNGDKGRIKCVSCNSCFRAMGMCVLNKDK